ncbi:unnamed protein product, partial [Ranitomeya imitator]
KDEDPEKKIEFKTRLGKSVLHKGKAYERNELFLPGRMAYVVDLDDEYADTDIPTTLIRAKPTVQPWRQGTRNKKLKKKDKGKLDEKKPPEADMNIFDDIGDYVPTTAKNLLVRRRKKSTEKRSGIERKSDPERETENEITSVTESGREKGHGTEKGDREKKSGNTATLRSQRLMTRPHDVDKGDQDQTKDLLRSINDNFAGAPCMDDMAVDSDEEVDYSKMDQGEIEKGLWDDGTLIHEEEYSDYMNNKEALPNMVLKCSMEGRKTRRFKETNEKADWTDSWKKISAIIEKRKKLEADR